MQKNRNGTTRKKIGSIVSVLGNERPARLMS
jgi:hypothetical protein